MIAGVGIDMVEVARIADKISKGNGFRELVFSEAEIAYCEPKPHKFEHYAARFAAKEAFFKAIGTGWLNGTAFNEIQITNEENGKPMLHIIGRSAETLALYGPMTVSVSLTHIKTMASAVVIIEK